MPQHWPLEWSSYHLLLSVAVFTLWNQIQVKICAAFSGTPTVQVLMNMNVRAAFTTGTAFDVLFSSCVNSLMNAKMSALAEALTTCVM